MFRNHTCIKEESSDMFLAYGIFIGDTVVDLFCSTLQGMSNIIQSNAAHFTANDI